MTGRLITSVVLSAALLVAATESSAQDFEGSMKAWIAGVKSAVGSIRVDTRQDSLSAEQGSGGAVNARMGQSSVFVEDRMTAQIKTAAAKHETMHANLVTGLCSSAAAERSSNDAAATVQNLQDELDGFEARWLERGGDRADTLVATHRIRRTALCTESERERGLCEGEPNFGVPPAADSDAGPFLLRRSYGSAEVDTGSLFVDTVAPFPTIGASDETISVAELSERARARRELAIVAISRSGLTNVLIRGVEGGIE